MNDVELTRLEEDARRTKNWKRWGPYLSDRQWGTVREDYSPNGECWGYFSHDHARSRAYRWGEDGLLGITDRECRLCFALALWNERDPILKERLFGLAGPEGNHGEDVKECYYYLDATPTHSYLKALYKYPQAEYPYARLVEALGARYESVDALPLLEGAKRHGPFDLIFEASGYSPAVFEAMQALGKNGVLVLSSVTGGMRTAEVPSDRINLGFVLGNKVMVGTVNANREYFEQGARDLTQAEADFPGWLGRLLTHPVRGLENYRQLFEVLTSGTGVIKAYCVVADA